MPNTKTFAFTLCLAALALAIASTPAAADIDLAFDSLPSAQGWTYNGSVPEGGAYTADGTTLHLDTLSSGDAQAAYSMSGVVNPALPFTLHTRARLIDSDGGAVAFSHSTGAEIFQLALFLDEVRVQGIDYPLDCTVFHDYRFECNPTVGAELYVDNNLLDSFSPIPSAVANSILFGDGAGNPNSNVMAQITRYSFQQIPEPTTLGLLVLTVVPVFLRRR